MPNNFKTHIRPKAIPHKPPIQTNKRKSKHTLSHEIGKNWATKALKYINGEPKNKGEVHLPVGSESKCKRGSKNPTMDAWGATSLAVSVNKWGSWVRGEFWVKKTQPNPHFYLTHAGYARPGELTLFFLKASLKTGILTSLHALDCVLHAALL